MYSPYDKDWLLNITFTCSWNIPWWLCQILILFSELCFTIICCLQLHSWLIMMIMSTAIRFFFNYVMSPTALLTLLNDYTMSLTAILRLLYGYVMSSTAILTLFYDYAISSTAILIFLWLCYVINYYPSITLWICHVQLFFF